MLTQQEILSRLSDLAEEYEADDCINWGDDAIDVVCNILDECGAAIVNPELTNVHN
jgi:hypothetical protein